MTCVKATFADGLTVKRSSHRTYTHAWRIGRRTGFSGSEQLAVAASRGMKGFETDRGVAPCVEITYQEYRRLR